MPNRILREGIVTSERVNALSFAAEVFYRRLMSVVDDFGRHTANAKLLLGTCYALQLDRVSLADIEQWLEDCQKEKLILVYEVSGKRFLELIDFKQQIRSKNSKCPSPDDGLLIECAADAKHMQSNAHLDVGEVGDVFEDGDGGVGISSSDTRGEEAPTPPQILPNSRAAAISILMRQNGILGCTSVNPIVIDWAADPKVTDEVLLAAAATAKARKALNPGPSYLQPIVAELANPPPPKPKRDNWDRTDDGIKRKAKELGVAARGGWDYKQLKDAVWDEIRRRERQGAAA